MTIILIILAIAALIYVYATLAFYYGFKNWHPICGTESSQCRRGEPCSDSSTAKAS